MSKLSLGICLREHTFMKLDLLLKNCKDETRLVRPVDIYTSSWSCTRINCCDDQSSSSEDSPRKYEGRLIYYYVVDDDGNVDDSVEGLCFQLKGCRLEELIERLEEETGLEDIIVCSRSRLNGKLYPLRLALPPDNAPMHIFIVPSTSRAANEFVPAAPTSPSLAPHS